MMFSIPSSAVNSGLDYYQKLLAVSFREKITDHFHDLYLQRMFYYKIQNLDSRITNPDQRLTKDAEMWANSLSTLFVNIAKPILDITMFSRKLAELIGLEGPLSVMGSFAFSGLVIKLVSPPFGRMIAMQQRVLAGLKTTFASHYSDRVELEKALELSAVQSYGRKATGQKTLVTMS